MPSVSDEDVVRLLEIGLMDMVQTSSWDDAGDDDGAPPLGTQFGEYTLIKRLGKGGSGVVYEAHNPGVDHTVALKLLIGGEEATHEDVQRFLRGAEDQMRLHHPNIVPVLHVGHEGQPYFTMPRLSRSLARQLKEQRLDPPSRGSWVDQQLGAAQLLATVARAIDHAHRNGVLHRDLKPANILLDEQGAPHIADFGLAKRLNEPSTEQQEYGILGTLHYMPPAQAARKSADITGDIHSLGVILYELLTFEVPFQGETVSEVLERIAGPEVAKPPRELEPRIDGDLERVCLKCLEKDKDRRYSTAAHLATDLECFLDGRPPSVPPRSRTGRALHWLRRRSEASARTARVLLGVALVVGTPSYLWRAARNEEAAALSTSAFIANGQAGIMLFRLREYADRLQQTASNSELAALARAKTFLTDPPLALKKLAEGFDAAFVLSTDGFLRAQWELPRRDIWQRTYAFRDYFQGARRLADQGRRDVYVAKAHRSERDDQLKFGVSMPLFDKDGWAGVLVAAVPVDSVLPNWRIPDSEGRHYLTALVGPRGIDRPQVNSVPREHFVFFIHEGLNRGEEVTVPKNPALDAAFREAAPPGQQFSLRYVDPRRMPNYEDPVRDFSKGQWLAAFAPVGGTGYVVVAQTRKSAGFDLTRGTSGLLLMLLIVPGFALILSGLFRTAFPRFGARRRRATVASR